MSVHAFSSVSVFSSYITFSWFAKKPLNVKRQGFTSSNMMRNSLNALVHTNLFQLFFCKFRETMVNLLVKHKDIYQLPLKIMHDK